MSSSDDSNGSNDPGRPLRIRAAVCRAFGQPLTVEALLLDSPQEGEVMVRLSACAICHSDIHYMDGAWGGETPSVFGHEAAGTVCRTGPGVTRAARGDRVIVTLLRSCGACYFCRRGQEPLCQGDFPLNHVSRLRRPDGEPVRQGLRTGGFADHVVVHQSQIAPVPDGVPLHSAAPMACAVITGLGAVRHTTAVEAGASVVVVGAGGVGLNSVQGARLAGADPIIVFDIAAAKRRAAARFGATHAYDPAEGDSVAAVRALTGGRGADYTFVTVGSAAAMQQAVGLVRPGGTLCLVGMPAAGVKLSLEALDLADYATRVIGSKMGSTRLGSDVAPLFQLYREGALHLDPLISNRYPLDRINEAIADSRRGESLRNLIVFD